MDELSDDSLLFLPQTVSLPVPDCRQAGGRLAAVSLSVFISLHRIPSRRKLVRRSGSEDGIAKTESGDGLHRLPQMLVGQQGWGNTDCTTDIVFVSLFA
ncbi:MAG: hypothetical protein ACQES1_03850 [Bacteroidota bacterium]